MHQTVVKPGGGESGVGDDASQANERKGDRKWNTCRDLWVSGGNTALLARKAVVVNEVTL